MGVGAQGPRGEKGDGVPVGTVVEYIGVNPPAGWLPLDGSEYPRTRFPSLARVMNANGDKVKLPKAEGRIVKVR